MGFLLKIILFFALVFQFVLQSTQVCAILLEGSLWNISVKLFLIYLGQWLMRKYRLKIYFYSSSGGYFSAERNHLSNF